MRVIDLDQMITVPVVDEGAGGKVFNTDMTIAEFFNEVLSIDVSGISFEAIPVKWLEDKAHDSSRAPLFQRYMQKILKEWRGE